VKKSVLISLFLFLVAGCSSKQERDLLGKWQETKNDNGVLIFLADHKGRAYWPAGTSGQDSSPMTWSIEKGGNKVTTVTPEGPVIFTLKDDRLIAPNGLELKKVDHFFENN